MYKSKKEIKMEETTKIILSQIDKLNKIKNKNNCKILIMGNKKFKYLLISPNLCRNFNPYSVYIKPYSIFGCDIIIDWYNPERIETIFGYSSEYSRK